MGAASNNEINNNRITTLKQTKIANKGLNPFMPNVFSHPFQLDESISNFRFVGWYFFIFIQILQDT